MEITAKYFNLTVDFKTGETLVTFSTLARPEEIEKQVLKLADKDCSLTYSQIRQKRSLNANAYFHVLVDKLADALTISKARCKNDMITSYGQKDFLDDEPICIKTNIPLEQMREQETLHCKYIKSEGEHVHFYWVYRGSHTYDSKEMSVLIDGTVAECKAQGIETLTPDELKRMYESWEAQHE